MSCENFLNNLSNKSKLIILSITMALFSVIAIFLPAISAGENLANFKFLQGGSFTSEYALPRIMFAIIAIICIFIKAFMFSDKESTLFLFIVNSISLFFVIQQYAYIQSNLNDLELISSIYNDYMTKHTEARNVCLIYLFIQIILFITSLIYVCSILFSKSDLKYNK